ncbi:hypothetical protein ACLKA7_007438 [Drosophila subpalustris]
MRMRHAFAGLIVCWLAVYQPQAEAQFAPFGGQVYGGQPGFFGGGRAGRGRQGSVSRANTNAYERQVDFGNNVEYTQGLSNSRAVTRQNGQRVVSDSQARTRDVDLGGLQIGNTLTRTRTNANGAVSGGIANQFRLGNLGLGASLSPDNLRQGFGLQRSADGNARLGLGLLSLDLDNNVQRSNSLGQAAVTAQGRGARVGSNSNSNTNTQQFGGLNVRETVSNSNAYGRTRNGLTSANAGGFGGNALTQGATYGGFPRQRRAPQQRPLVSTNRRQLRRPKRRAQYVPFGYPQQSYNNFGYNNYGGGFGGFGGGNFQNTERPRRQFGRPNNNFDFGFPQQQQGGRKRGQVQSSGNAGAQGGPGFNQQAGSNNFANQNADGSQNGGSSSIGSNLAEDGSSGQVSSANTNQQSGLGSQSNGAQSQALNFDADGQQASSSNANTQHTRDGDRETIGSNSGSTATNNNAGGSSTNIANTDTQVVRDGNQQTVTSGANSQSIFQGNQGHGNAAANTAANISSQIGPNGSVTNSASSSATATATNGQSANASANASAGGRGGNAAGSGANAGASGGNKRHRGGANSNANAFGGFGFGLRYRAQQKVQQQHWRPRSLNLSSDADQLENLYINRSSRLEDLQPKVNTSIDAFGDIDAGQRQGRTISLITDWFNSLFGSCVSPCTLEAYQQNRCCETYVIGPPQTCCAVGPALPPPPPPSAPLPPPPPPLPPPPPPPRQPLPPPRYPQPYPLPGPLLPNKDTPIMMMAVPINCCTVCTYTYYGPPPCGRFNTSDNKRVTVYIPPPYYG